MGIFSPKDYFSLLLSHFQTGLRNDCGGGWFLGWATLACCYCFGNYELSVSLPQWLLFYMRYHHAH